MTSLENLYYAAGELAYVVAKADGAVQPEERIKFAEIVKDTLSGSQDDVDIASIIFQLLDNKKHLDLESTYKWAMDTIRAHSHALGESMKLKFILLLEKVAAASEPVTEGEREIIARFRDDIAPISGNNEFTSVH